MEKERKKGKKGGKKEKLRKVSTSQEECHSSTSRGSREESFRGTKWGGGWLHLFNFAPGCQNE